LSCLGRSGGAFSDIKGLHTTWNQEISECIDLKWRNVHTAHPSSQTRYLDRSNQYLRSCTLVRDILLRRNETTYGLCPGHQLLCLPGTDHLIACSSAAVQSDPKGTHFHSLSYLSWNMRSQNFKYYSSGSRLYSGGSPIASML